MKRLIALLSVGTALIALAGGAYARQIHRLASDVIATSANLDLPAQRSAECTELKATSEVFWFQLNEDNEEVVVESYPSGTTRIAAQFELNCIPRRTTIVTVWSLDGKTILTLEDKPRAVNRPYIWSAWLSMRDDSPLPDGEYGVAFYANKKLIVEGEVIVGGENGDAVTVEGKVADSRSGRPIRNAQVVVLKEGVSGREWLNRQSEEEVLAYAVTDSKGEFVLNNPIPVGVPHDLLAGARGYQIYLEEDWTIEEDEAEDPLFIEIELVRSGR
jgi:hypothetical protein